MKSWIRRATVLLVALSVLGPGSMALAREPEFVTVFPTAADVERAVQSNVPLKVDNDTYLIIVDKATQVVSVMRQGDDKQYSVLVRQMRCSTGRKPDYTPLGTFSIYAKSRWLRAVNGQYVQYACRFNKHILIHSLSYNRANARKLDTRSYADLGQPVSAGCVRLLARDSQWIFENCPIGTRVKVVSSGGPTVSAVEPIPELPAGQTWDPTDPAISAKVAS